MSDSAAFRIVTPTDADWPSGLNRLSDPPLRLYLQGTLPELTRAVAIVGTRYADPEAIEFTKRLAADLASAGATVISGGARGIDAAAHRGAIDAGGKTIVVLPTGLSEPYPREHAPLFSEALASGALLSEVGPGEPVSRRSFLHRNRIVAALSTAVVIVQAPLRSGALSTAAHARALSTPLFAVPASPWDVRGAGGCALLRADSRVCTSAADVLSVAAFAPASAGVEVEKSPRKQQVSTEFNNLSAPAQQVWQHLSSRPRTADEITQLAGISPEAVQAALTELALDGWIFGGEPRGFVRRKRAHYPFNGRS